MSISVVGKLLMVHFVKCSHIWDSILILGHLVEKKKLNLRAINRYIQPDFQNSIFL